ncbi:MAG: hypothetical protein K1X28_07805 [Parachlamydiales bacterium]|nr:hypothetical protein [Parachlamydiales bacterium]
MSVNAAGVNCVICHDSEAGAMQALPCAHTFHEACIQPWLNQRGTCPTCRFQVNAVQQPADNGDVDPNAEPPAGFRVVFVPNGEMPGGSYRLVRLLQVNLQESEGQE